MNLLSQPLLFFQPAFSRLLFYRNLGFIHYVLGGIFLVILFHAINNNSPAFVLLLPYLLLLKDRGASQRGMLVCAGLLLASPTYITWQRISVDDAGSLFFSLFYVYAVQRYIRRPALLNILGAGFCALIAGILKIGSFFTFHLVVGFLLIEAYYKNRLARGSAGAPHLLMSSGALIVCLLLPLGLAAYFGRWEIGTWEHHVSPYRWTPMLTREFNAAVGLENFVLYCFLALLLFARKSLWSFIIALFLFVVPMFVFTNEHFFLERSAFDNGIFCITAVGLAINGLLAQPQRWLRGFGLALFFITAFSAIERYKLL